MQVRAKSLPVHLGGVPTPYKDGLWLRQVKKILEDKLTGELWTNQMKLTYLTPIEDDGDLPF